MESKNNSLLNLSSHFFITQISYVLVITTDILFMGTLGKDVLAGGGLAFSVFSSYYMLCYGTINFCTNLLSGKDVATEAKKLFSSYVSVIFIFFLGGVAVYAGTSQALRLLDFDPNVQRAFSEYLVLMLLSLLFQLAFVLFRCLAAASKDLGHFSKIAVGSLIANALFNWVFIEMSDFLFISKIQGIALSSILVSLFAFLLAYRKYRNAVPLGPVLKKAGRFEASKILFILKLGFPLGGAYLVESAFITIAGFICGTYGTNALVAHTIGFQFIYLFFQIPVSISNALSVHISYFYKVGEWTGVRKIFWKANAYCLFSLALFFVTVKGFGDQLIPLFLTGEDDLENILPIVHGLLNICLLSHIFDCAQNIASGALRGIHVTSVILKYSIIGYWLIGVTASYLLGTVLGYGLYGVWLGITLGIFSATVLLIRSFLVNTQAGMVRQLEMVR